MIQSRDEGDGPCRTFPRMHRVVVEEGDLEDTVNGYLARGFGSVSFDERAREPWQGGAFEVIGYETVCACGEKAPHTPKPKAKAAPKQAKGIQTPFGVIPLLAPDHPYLN